MKLKTKLSKLRHDGHITDAEYAIIINVLNKFSTQPCKNWYDVPSDEMTLEQARQAVKDLRKKLAEYLEQQPCEDAISRLEVRDLLATWLTDNLTEETWEVLETIDGKVEDMQSVIPTTKPCEDAISREEVKNEIRRWIGYLDEDMIFRINVGIDRLPSVTPWPVWIPVSEKLPEPLTAVLLTVRYKSTGILTYQMGYWVDTLERWEKWLESGTLEEEFEIIAWMELPEKYEEDNDEW